MEDRGPLLPCQRRLRRRRKTKNPFMYLETDKKKAQADKKSVRSDVGT